MPDEKNTPEVMGAGYALSQTAKAADTLASHEDPETRTRAQGRIADWTAVFGSILDGTLAVGSRTPLEGTPAWVTLHVLTGGFALNEPMAGGPLQAHERALLARLPQTPRGDEARQLLNTYYLSEDGLGELFTRLESGRYTFTVPEEGALLVFAWLVQNGHTKQAQELLETLAPWFSRLRFYPVPTEQARYGGSRVFVRNVQQTIDSLNEIKPNARILAQKEAVCVWTPLYDRLVQLFLETVEGPLPYLRCETIGKWVRAQNGKFPVEGGWPCQQYPGDWAARATQLLNEYAAMLHQHTLCGRTQDARNPGTQLRELLQRCVQNPASLSGREVGRIRLILARYITKHYTPDSARCRAQREPQKQHASLPLQQEIAQAILPRLRGYSPSEGVDDINPLVAPLSPEESTRNNLPPGTVVPAALQEKVQRCLRDTIDVLAKRGLVPSGEVLAQVLPQMTAGIRAAGFADPVLRRLHAALYEAFRRRRSLLLLNLEHQVQIEELPWVTAIEPFRQKNLQAKESARQVLTEVSLLTLTTFPQAIVPNKLLQELRALAKTAELSLPLVEEIAADIFMGEFSGKFLEAAKQAAGVLENTLYATYYEIDYAQIRAMQEMLPAKTSWLRRTAGIPGPTAFVSLCAARAGVPLGGWKPAISGMVIEQQQILTSQNLATLFAGLPLAGALENQLSGLARHNFQWICARQQVKTDSWHARLIQMKNTAYAWRQMIFFLALSPKSRVDDFLAWASAHLSEQPQAFQNRFRPALTGLMLAAKGISLDDAAAKQQGAQRFLGWTQGRHWLLGDADKVA